MALTGRTALLAAVAALVLLFLPGWGFFLCLNLFLLLLVSIDLALAGSVRGLRLSRQGGTRGRQGEDLEVALVLTNGGTRTVRATVRDAWPPSAGASPRTHRAVIPRGETRRVVTVLRPSRRGDRRPERITVRSLGPLGLAGRQGRHAVPWQVRVLPPFGSRRFLPERLARLREVEGQVAVRGAGRGTELDGLRSYVPGDDARAVDWRATARRGVTAAVASGAPVTGVDGGLMVRTYRPERDRRIVLCLDTGRTAAARVGDAPRLDAALDAGLLLAALAERAGDTVDLLAYDAVLRADVRGGHGPLLPRLVDVMALLEPQLVESDPAVLVGAVLRRVRRRALVVIFTELNAAALEEGLFPALPALTSRHAVVVAAVTDPETELLARGRGTAAAVYAAAAAEKARTGRRRVATELSRRGVTVVDASATTFAPAVADTYLALKASGRL
jgi:uncharacterized protein (DUF58 family)